MTVDPCATDATELAEALQTRRLDPLMLLEATLERIDAIAGSGTFVTVDPDGARAAAEAAWTRRNDGAPRSPLDGIPLALKDNLVTRGLRTTCGSRLMAAWIPPYEGAASGALAAAGAVRVGKTNLDEFGMGSSGEHSAFGPTLNPSAPGCVPGGSSSGSAAAVAAGAVPLALGTDTGGSVRLPAAFCGLWGLQPSYGRISRWGLVAHASSLDRVGLIGRSPRDLASALRVLAGPDPRDATCAARPVPSYTDALRAPPHPMTVGLPTRDALRDLAPDVDAAVDAVADALGRAGHRIVRVEVPSADRALDAYHVLASAEAASNLARFDGMRYGQRRPRNGFAATLRASRDAGLGVEVRRRILLGTWVTSNAQYEAVYVQALRARTAIARTMAAAWDRADVLLTPVAPSGPFPFGARRDDPWAMYATDRWTIPASLAGACGLAVPLRGGPHPGSVLLTAAPFAEARLLALGHALAGFAEELVGAVTPRIPEGPRLSNADPEEL